MSNTAAEVLDDLLTGDRAMFAENDAERTFTRPARFHGGIATTRIQHTRSGEVYEVSVKKVQ